MSRKDSFLKRMNVRFLALLSNYYLAYCWFTLENVSKKKNFLMDYASIISALLFIDINNLIKTERLNVLRLNVKKFKQ